MQLGGNHEWAVVTGASSGIGLAFARELSRRGHGVLAVARRLDRLEALAKGAADFGGKVEPLAADLSTPSGLAKVIRRAAELGAIELLINNAGLATGGDFLGMPIEPEIAALRVNVEAVVTLTHAIGQMMIREKRGGILNLASVVAFQPFPHFAVYAATKAFVLSFTEALAVELKGTGVRIAALCPGNVGTEMDVFAHNEGLLGKLPSLTAEQVVEAGLAAIGHGDVVRVVGWLNRLLPLTDRVMPRSVVRWLMGASAKPPRGMYMKTSKP
jgi:uncharacterized protein